MTDPNLTPPPELVQQWGNQWITTEGVGREDIYVATQAARWGADAELEACCEWMAGEFLENQSRRLRAARRPQPQPSLKERALKEQALKERALKERALKALEHLSGWEGDADTIRRALELVPDAQP